LLVGINDYPGAPLQGCLRDVASMQDMLTARGYASADIQVLLDRQATCEAIRSHLAGLLAGVVSGDQLWFHYSGHGTQVLCRDGDEDDGYDEALCPVDWDWDNRDTQLTDDVLHDLIAAAHLPAGMTLVVSLDSCHSGSMLREIDVSTLGRPRVSWGAPRFLPPPFRVLSSKRSRQFARSVAVLPGALLISGCRADQTSADAEINGAYHGAATFALTRAVENGKLTPRLIVEEMNRWLSSIRFNQSPQLEGDDALFDHPLFIAAARRGE
jgi:hypothetical protein